jgi:hypothetical protein
MVKILFAALTLTFAQLAAAQTQASAGVRGYGQAGCGLGSLVFGSQKGPVQILAATLNGTGIQTFGMTSGTSNCKAVFGRDATDFIDANRMTLAKEMARGEGETLDSLAVIYRCQNTSAVSEVLKSNYGEIFSAPDKHSAAINESIINVLKKDKSAGCDILS